MTTSTPDPLPILFAPDPRLKAKTRPVSAADRATVRAIVPRMLATMYAAPGIGLAAPQVGLDLRFAVIDLQPDEKPAPITLINPRIEQKSREEATREEGCLSLPGHYAEVTRPERVVVAYEDLDGQPQTIAAEGLLATCLQHEIDHLDGILFVDHLSALKRNIILRKMAKEKRARKIG
jgi:peptide deformylase